MEVDTLHASPLQDLFLHWMSLPSTELFIKQQLQLLRSPLSPSATMRDEDDTAVLESHKGRNGERRNSSDKASSARGPTEDDDEEGSSRPKFVINIPADDVTPSASTASSLSTSPALLPVTGTPPQALSNTALPSLPSSSHSPPHATTAVQSHRVALRVDTDTRFASTTNAPTVSSTSSSHSPPLSPKSPARQSPPASHSPDPSQHSPHKKRKSSPHGGKDADFKFKSELNNTNSPPATSPSASPTTAFAATSPATISATSRVATASPPKSPRAATPPRSPLARSPSASNVAAADKAAEVGSESRESAIRRFYYPKGQPCSAEVRRKDERRIRRLFRKAILKHAQAEERKRAGEEEKEEEEEEETEDADEARVEDESDDGGASGDGDTLTLRREQLYPLTTAVCGFSSYCLAAGTRVTLGNGTSMKIECMVDDRPTSLLSYDEQQHGCVYQPTEGKHLLRQGLKQCVELQLDDGRTLLCTADHRVRTLRGDVQAQHLTADDRIISAPEGPLVTFDKSDEWMLPLQLSDARPLRLRMKVQAEWERCLAFARLLGFTSVDCSGRSLLFSHLLDAQSVAADIAIVLGCSTDDVIIQSSADCVAAISVTLPIAVDHALAAYRAANDASLPAFITATDMPGAFVREFLAGLFGRVGTAPELSHTLPRQWTAVKCLVPGGDNNHSCASVQAELISLLDSLGVSAEHGEQRVPSTSVVVTSPTALFADNIGFRYSVAKQQRLSLAARWYRGQAVTPYHSVDQYLDACGAASFIFSSDHKSNSTVLPTWHVGLISRRSAGLHPTYDLSVHRTHLFVANGVVVHNCNNALFAALLLHAKVYFPHHFKQGAVEEDSSAAKTHGDEEKTTPKSSDMDTTKDNSNNTTTPNATTTTSAANSQPPTPTTTTAVIHLETFLSYYFTHLQPFDPPTRFFRLLLTASSPTLPTTHPYHLTRDHFKPLVSEIVNRHPGLEFLHSTPEFQFKYAQTVIARIFYAVNASGNERLTLYELKQSNLLLMLSLLDSEDDINKLNDYFSYEHFYVIYCVCQGTLVNLADGTSVPIEQVSAQDSVLSYTAATADQKEGLTPRQVTHVSAVGVKECVELLFSDGRTLTCTPDHRILTADGRWVEANALVLGVDDVAVGAEYPDSTLGAEPTAEWRLDLQASLGYELDMAERARHSLAFARLLGYLVTDGTANDDYSVWYIGHQLDADAMQRDTLLLTGVAPTVTAGTRTLQMSAPRPLHRAFQHVSVEGGKRTSQISHFPAFVTAADCPLPIVREFLGGLFGGDGCTLHLSHGDGIKRLTGLGFVATRIGDVAEQQQAVLQQELLVLLQRCGVDTKTITASFVLVAPNIYSEEGAAEYSELQARGAKLTPTVTKDTLDPNKRYWLRFLISAAGVTSFARRVGFRYSCHKQQRLSAAVAYYRGHERYLEQKRHLSARTLELRGDPPTRRIADALQQAKAELGRDEQLLPRIADWRPTQVAQLLALSKAPFYNDNVEKQLQAMNSRRFFSAPRRKTPYRGDPVDGDELDECYWCAETHWEQEGNPMLLCDGEGCEQCGHLTCFLLSDALASTRRVLTDEPEGKWLCPDCDPAAFGDEEEDEDDSASASSASAYEAASNLPTELLNSVTPKGKKLRGVMLNSARFMNNYYDEPDCKLDFKQLLSDGETMADAVHGLLLSPPGLVYGCNQAGTKWAETFRLLSWARHEIMPEVRWLNSEASPIVAPPDESFFPLMGADFLVSHAGARQPDWLRELLRRRKAMRACPPLSGSQAVDAVTYGVHADARVLPLFRVRLVGRRAVGAKHVYDLTVPSEQGDHTASFTASGVVVHNCKFWELDSDHDGFIDQSDLATYDDYSLTSKMIERVIGGHGRPLLSTQVGKMNYLDFIVFLVSEVDKSNRISIAYWY